MLTEKQQVQLSKLLSKVLRHQPQYLGLVLDEQGWVSTTVLLEKLHQHGFSIDFEMLKYLVDTNPKKRFAFNEDFQKIRASQGHSVAVSLGYQAQEPPEILYHGTALQNVASILEKGLEKRERHHVHLSTDINTALKVGQRHGKPFIFEVLAKEMHQNKHDFFLSENGVWLTEHVPTKYLKNHS